MSEIKRWIPCSKRLPEPYCAEAERPQTNADRIRSMTDDELADAFMQCSNISMSKNDWLRWLQEESEEKDEKYSI